MVVKIAKAGYDMGNDLLRPGYDGPHGEYTAEQMLEAAEKASGQCNIPVNAIATVMLTPDWIPDSGSITKWYAFNT